MGLYGANGDMTLRDCYELSKANPKCGRTIWMTTPYQSDPARCYCWTNHTATNACCGGCVYGLSGGYYNSFYLEDMPPFRK